MESKRIEYIDIAKGLCMILVVWQHVHTYYPNLQTGESYLESFRMPLFFFVSGMFFKAQNNFRVFLKKKVNTIIIPFLFFYMLFSVIVPNTLHAIGYEGLRQSSKLGWFSVFNCIFERTYSNNPVWFLLALFWLNLLFYGLVFVANKVFIQYRFYCIVIGACVMGGGGFMLGVHHVFLWANIDNALTVTPYFFLGFLIHMRTSWIQKPPQKSILSILVLIASLFIYLFSPGLGYKQNSFPLSSFVPLYLCGVVGSILSLAVSKIIDHSKLLVFYGENTLIMLCLQMPIIQVANLFVKKFEWGGYWGMAFTFVITLIVFLFIIPIFNKYLPYVVGKK